MRGRLEGDEEFLMPALPPLQGMLFPQLACRCARLLLDDKSGGRPRPGGLLYPLFAFFSYWNSIQQPRLCSLLCKMLLKKGG